MKSSLQHREEMHEDAPQFENQTNLMKNRVQTEDGDLVEIINGTLECPNTAKNWLTIADWMMTEVINGATIKVSDDGNWIKVDFPESVPTHKMESLLEHFEYQ